MMSDQLIVAITWFYWAVSLGVLYACTLTYGWRSGCFWFAMFHCVSTTTLLISEYALNAPGLEFLAERPHRPVAFRISETIAFSILFCWLMYKRWRLYDE